MAQKKKLRKNSLKKKMMKRFGGGAFDSDWEVVCKTPAKATTKTTS